MRFDEVEFLRALRNGIRVDPAEPEAPNESDQASRQTVKGDESINWAPGSPARLGVEGFPFPCDVGVSALPSHSRLVTAATTSLALTEPTTYVRSTKPSFFAADAVTALVLGGGTAFAATGGNFILGRSNAATTTTTLTNSAGTALAVNSKAGTPTLKVGNTVRIPSLNADTVDGVHAGSFARTAGRTGSFDFPGQAVDSDGNRKTDTIVASGACPSGTQLTGGGMSDFTQTGFTVVNAPDVDPESWLVAVPVDETVAENPTDVVA